MSDVRAMTSAAFFLVVALASCRRAAPAVPDAGSEALADPAADAGSAALTTAGADADEADDALYPPPRFMCWGDHVDSDREFVFQRKLEGRNPRLPSGVDAGPRPIANARCVVRRGGRLDDCRVTWLPPGLPSGTDAEVLSALSTWRVTIPWECPHRAEDGGETAFVPLVDTPLPFFPHFDTSP